MSEEKVPHSPTPWTLHRTGSHLGIKDAAGKFVIRKTVNMMSIPDYDRLLANFKHIAERTGEAEHLQCPMCGAANAFTIDPADKSRGYCFVEDKAWTLRPVAPASSTE